MVDDVFDFCVHKKQLLQSFWQGLLKTSFSPWGFARAKLNTKVCEKKRGHKDDTYPPKQEENKECPYKHVKLGGKRPQTKTKYNFGLNPDFGLKTVKKRVENRALKKA